MHYFTLAPYITRKYPMGNPINIPIRNTRQLRILDQIQYEYEQHIYRYENKFIDVPYYEISISRYNIFNHIYKNGASFKIYLDPTDNMIFYFSIIQNTRCIEYLTYNSADYNCKNAIYNWPI